MKVICIDNLLTGNLDNIAHLFGNSDFSYIKHDVTNYIYVGGDIDYVLHFASPASPIDYLKASNTDFKSWFTWYTQSLRFGKR